MQGTSAIPGIETASSRPAEGGPMSNESEVEELRQAPQGLGCAPETARRNLGIVGHEAAKDHMKSGGCWTAKRAKRAEWHIIHQNGGERGQTVRVRRDPSPQGDQGRAGERDAGP